MKKLMIGVALATCISSVAMAEEKKVSSVLPKIDMSFVTDTERNVTQETTSTKFGVVAGIKGFDLSVKPSFSWDDSEISNVEFWGGYTFDVNESFGITPYGEVNFNNDFETADKIVGVKTEYKF
jgi:hypothetical protein|tara:strand:+ start:180 stop:551 length:372 start_codon:yes stop_codon:yes gene_type:complete